MTDTSTPPVLQSVPLGPQWPTIDPFLFCAHHDDAYPAANDRFGPAAPLDGRQLGMDFEGIDGWRMYHGQVVPGFPQHPHRGFETVTYARRGYIDHSDSIGASARFGRGDVQWMTAGGGVVHSEMFPLLDRDGPNPVELFQIWLNLPAEDKLVEPHFSMLWAEDIPVLEHTDDAGRSTTVTVIAGELSGLRPPPPPPKSWAGHADADVAIWHLRLDDGARFELPGATGPDTVRTIYVFDGDGASLGGQPVGARTGNVVQADRSLDVVASAGPVECLVLQGRPIGEPVAQYGPFVMNNRAEVQQAIEDYQRTGFGGWPWPTDDPVHDRDGRFARHANGRTERP
ncbi:MAG: pirin family protein [Acidimicrobiales bacterium]|nr:pirin family protein [Acidimicrobiales bacterium]